MSKSDKVILTKEKEQELLKQIEKGQSLQMLSYIFKLTKEFIIKFARSKELVLRKKYEVDYIKDLTLHNKKYYISGLLKK